MEGHVDSRTDAGREDDIAVVDEFNIFSNGRARGELFEQGDRAMVCSGFEVVQQVGFSQQQGAGADGEQKVDVFCGRGDPIDQGGIVDLSAGADTAGDEKNVWRGAGVEGVSRVDAQAVDGEKWAGILGDGVDIERPGSDAGGSNGENFERAGEVEDFDIGEEEDGEVAGGHMREYRQ